jgi:hypothetical protein
MIQQSKWLGGGSNSRKSSGGWGTYLNTEADLVWGGYSWHTFANLGILTPHNILQSTQYHLPIWAAYHRGVCNNENRIGANKCVKMRAMRGRQIQTNWLHFRTLPNLGVLYVAEIK